MVRLASQAAAGVGKRTRGTRGSGETGTREVVDGWAWATGLNVLWHNEKKTVKAHW